MYALANSFNLYRMPLPTRTGQRWRLGQQSQHGKYYKPIAPSRHDHVGGSGQRRLRAGSATNIWDKKNRRASRLKIHTYNIRTLQRNEHIHEIEKDQVGMERNQDLRIKKT